MAVAERFIKPQTQPTVEIYDAGAKDRETPRWLGYVGDRIPRRRKQENHWLRIGGCQERTVCIQKYVVEGYIPRAYATPVEQGRNIMPMDHLRHAGGKRLGAVSVEGEIIANNRDLGYTLVEPGDAVQNILRRAHNDHGMRNGVVELKSLYGRTWAEGHKPDESGVLDRVEALCFADGQAETLRELKNQIVEGLKLAALENLRFDDGKLFDLDTFGLEWEQSAADFYEWGMAKLDEENTNLRTGTHSAGLVYRYSALGELLLTQLEVVRQDRSQIEQWNQQFSQMRSQGQAAPEFNPSDLIELGRRLAQAEQQLAAKDAELETLRNPQKEHWKTREKREREAAAQQGEE
jgi:hypothetical protein